MNTTIAVSDVAGVSANPIDPIALANRVFNSDDKLTGLSFKEIEQLAAMPWDGDNLRPIIRQWTLPPGYSDCEISATLLKRRNIAAVKAQKQHRQAAAAATVVQQENFNLAERIFFKREPVKSTKYIGPVPTRETRLRVSPFGRQFAKELFRKGSPYPNNNFWYPIGDPIIDKISLENSTRGGAFWKKPENAEDRKFNRNPIGGSSWIMAWVYRFYGMDAIKWSDKGNSIRCKETHTLHQAVRDINAWCEKMENGYTPEQPMSNEERLAIIAEMVNTVLPTDGYRIRGSALKIRKGIVEELKANGCSENDLREAFPELFSPQHFLELLSYWSKCGNPFFTVREQERANKTYTFTLQKVCAVLPCAVSG